MKIAFIAMSGIRVCNEELLGVGLTLPGFVERSKVIASLPSLGLLTLAGMTPERHEMEYLEVAELKNGILNNEIPFEFDLVAISSYSAQINEAYQLGDLFRKRGTKVVLGGLHVSSVPDEAALHADAVVIGEGELCWNELLDDCERGKLKSRYDCSDLEFDLANAPVPAYELLDIDKYNRLTVQVSRGCPHRCDFCASSILLTKKYKQKPIANVLAEIDRIKEVWDVPFIEFADDNCFVNKQYWHELLPELDKRKFKWFAETDISLASDPEMLTMMRNAGCSQVLIGFESPTRDALKGIEIGVDWKLKQWSRYKEAIQTVQCHGISVNGCFVVGLDGHDRAVFGDIVDFVKDSGLHEVQITLPTAFPGTPFYERLKSEGRLLEETNWKKLTLFDLNFRPARMSVSELESGFKSLVVDLYSDEFTLQRKRAFKNCLRAARSSSKRTTAGENQLEPGSRASH